MCVYIIYAYIYMCMHVCSSPAFIVPITRHTVHHKPIFVPITVHAYVCIRLPKIAFRATYEATRDRPRVPKDRSRMVQDSLRSFQDCPEARC